MTKTSEEENKMFGMMNGLGDEEVDLVIEWILINAEDQMETVKAKMADKLELRRLQKELAEAKTALRVERAQRTKERNKLEKQIEQMKSTPDENLVVAKAKPGATTKVAASEKNIAAVVPKEEPPSKPTKKVKKTAVAKAKEEPEEKEDKRTIDKVPQEEIDKVRKWGEKMTIDRLQTSLKNQNLVPWHRTVAEEILASKKAEAAPPEPRPEPQEPKPVSGETLTDNASVIRELLSDNTVETFDSVVEAAEAMGIPELDAYNAIDELESKGHITFPESGKLQIVN